PTTLGKTSPAKHAPLINISLFMIKDIIESKRRGLEIHAYSARGAVHNPNNPIKPALSPFLYSMTYLDDFY
ncbi:hypothetical protein ACQKC7_18710, partial [Pseudoalteromonas tetraodonis]|uniref:hypothetical protein n=1 Tax=Pseudoalteromonas tetraodonis TaxID=43659 RepID=UPI003D021D7C